MNHRTIITLRPAAREMRLRNWLQLAASACVRTVRKWRKAQRGRWMLSTYNDRLLADVGLTRQQVGHVERADRFLWR